MKPARARPVSQAWMVTFVDLIAICVAFFVLLHAMGAPATRGWSQAANALGNRLGAPAARIAPVLPPADALDRVHGLLRTRLGQNAPIARRADRVVLDLPTAALFEGAPTLAADGQMLVAALAETLAPLAVRIDITGFPPTADASRRPMQSWRLSFGQAAALGAALREAGFAGRVASLAAGAGRPERRLEIAIFDDGGDADAR